jgi:hypothetical protein
VKAKQMKKKQPISANDVRKPQDKPMKKNIVSAALLALVSLAATPSLATPSQCQSGMGRNGYNAGLAFEARFIDHLWAQYGDCHEFESFITAIAVPFAGSAPTSTYLKCREMGIVDALWNKVDEVAVTCMIECAATGSAIGKLQADIYCRVADMFGDDTANETVSSCPVNLCDIIGEGQCRADFQYDADANCPSHPVSDTTLTVGCSFSG